MADSNRVRFSQASETTAGTLVATPRMRTILLTGESLKYSPTFFTPATIRSDRMNISPSPINDQNSGAINFESTYPVDASYLSDWYKSAFQSTWVNTNSRDNDGTADSVITNVAATVITVTTGTAFVIGDLVRTTGFTAAANNTLSVVTTGGATSFTAAAATFTVDAAPAAAARAKMVGIQGVSGDITAAASGLGSTTMDFTAHGLAVGQWIEVGGAGATFQFATAACRGYMRITAIAATALTCDNLPTGWTTDAGTSKTIRVFFSDYIRNGVTPFSLSIERAFLDQTTPTYILQKGMQVDSMALTAVTEQAITGSVNFMGMSGTSGTAANGTTYDAAPVERVFTANISVGRVQENGSTVITPNFVRQLDINIANNLREDTALGTRGAIRIGSGDNLITGTLGTYFGSSTLLDKIRAGTLSSISMGASAANATGNGYRAIRYTIPVVTFTGGDPNAGAKNQSLVIPMTFQGSIDSVTSCQIQCDRFEYVEEIG